MTHPQLKGKTRYRVLNRFLRQPILVLQVEIEFEHFMNAGGMVESETLKRWVDVRPEQLMEHEK